ncbi:adenine phosphoribosyltransferase [Streptomyces sulfonofaciens]|uniref:Adenine phosphoribosyltransferase n=1 Tax=Streptomyces sulfonofaciens TaxID=68272 RepID=A0A919GQ64_9ACTN|nr:adenine phosphoribosyltransferase [Streptomyces sulfonofaciens]GHH88697.1 adenine phosphoribosyltransferase [Streptomyces sulfonofaciens]
MTTNHPGPAHGTVDPDDARAADILLGRRLAGFIRDVPDYPRPGVQFKDITPLLADPDAFSSLVELLASMCVRRGATRIAGLEARGFLLAAPVAVRAGLGFVPVRKAGKLPGPVLARGYELEYGTATIEIQQGAFGPGDRVVVVDDVLATGGTAEAAVELIRGTGAQVAGVAVLLELGFLLGRDRLKRSLDGDRVDAAVIV